MKAGVLVRVAVGEGVETGNIKVIAGRGIRVVVAVFEGVNVAEDVRVGELVGPVAEGVTGGVI